MTKTPESTTHQSFYGHAYLYDMAFAWRKVDQECEFMLKQAREVGCEVRSCLELASGPSRHAIWLGSLPDIRAHALDLSSQMLGYAQEMGALQSADLTLHCEDMCDFDLGEVRVDLAFCLIDSIAYVLDHDSFRSHMASVARCLRDGGVYFIETNHPKDPLVEETTETNWSVELDDSIVHVTFGLEGDVFDPVTQVTQTTVRLVQTRGEEVLVELEEVCPTKVYLFQELLALLAGSPFKLVGCWGAMDEGVAIDDPERAWRSVLMLKKKTKGE